MTLTITPIYAGLVGLLLVTLSFRVIFRRRSAGVTIGDGADKDLTKRIRVQANCAEYAPIGILLLAISELQGAPVWSLHALGVALIAGRAIHAVGLGSTPQIIPLRKLGMLLTFVMIAAASLGMIGSALF
jgi:uncharacterized membrane protein YecN with MAPEG domain